MRPGLRQVEYLSDQPEAACALHHAGGSGSRTATYQIGDSFGHLPEFSRLRSVRSHQRERPYPGTPCAPNCPRVQGGNIYRYVSEANFEQNQLMMNTNVRIGSKIQLFGYYSLNYSNSDASGVSSFASNSYNIRQDYGRATFDIRDRVFLGGSISLPYLFRLSPFMVISSGSPFNITSPIDVNGDQLYNDRPGLISTATCPTNPPQGSGPQKNIYLHHLGHVRRARGRQTAADQLRDWPDALCDELSVHENFWIRPQGEGYLRIWSGPGRRSWWWRPARGWPRGSAVWWRPVFLVGKFRPPLQPYSRSERPQPVQRCERRQSERGSGFPPV